MLNGIQDAIQASIKLNKEKDEMDEKVSSEKGVETKACTDDRSSGAVGADVSFTSNNGEKGGKKGSSGGSKEAEMFRWEAFDGNDEQKLSDPQSQSLHLLIATSIGMSTALLDAFTDFKQKCVAIEGIATSLVEIYKSFVNEKIKHEGTEKSSNTSSTVKKTLLHDKPYAFSCPHGSPLDQALNKVEMIMMKYWQHVHEVNQQDFTETLTTANASVSFIFIVALIRNSLSKILIVVEILLTFPEVRLMSDVLTFWQALLVSSLPLVGVDGEATENALIAGEILRSIGELSAENATLFPIASTKDAADVIVLIETFSATSRMSPSIAPKPSWFDNTPCWSDQSWDHRSIIAASAATLLQTNIQRVMPSVPKRSRESILDVDLRTRLKSCVENMLQDASRDPSSDRALSCCILLYATIKDVLIPDSSAQFKQAGDLLTASLSYDQLTPGQRSLGATLMHELTSSNLTDMLQYADADALIQALLSILDAALEKQIKLSVIERNFDEETESSIETSATKEEHQKQMVSLNRVVMHVVTSIRHTVHSGDKSKSNKELCRLVILCSGMVKTAKKHIEIVRNLCKDGLKSTSGSVQDFNKNLQDILVNSFVGSVVPIVLFSLHSLLREIEWRGSSEVQENLSSVTSSLPPPSIISNKIYVDPEIAAKIIDTFAKVVHTFQEAYTAFISSRNKSASFNLAREVSLTATEEADQTSGALDESIISTGEGDEDGPPMSRMNSLNRVLSRNLSINEKGYAKLEDLKWDGDCMGDQLRLLDGGVVVTSSEPDDDDEEPDGNHAVCATLVYDLNEGPSNTGNYFEIEVLESEDCAIGVGLCDRSMDLDEMPGHNSDSYGYHGDDGARYYDSDRMGDTDADWTTWSENDVIGCGIDFEKRSIFYTRNGKMIGTGFSDLHHDRLSPTVGIVVDMRNKVRVNFGTSAFAYNGPEVILHPSVKAMKSNPNNKGTSKGMPSSLPVDQTPLPWLYMIVHEILSIRLLAAKALIGYANTRGPCTLDDNTSTTTITDSKSKVSETSSHENQTTSSNNISENVEAGDKKLRVEKEKASTVVAIENRKKWAESQLFSARNENVAAAEKDKERTFLLEFLKDDPTTHDGCLHLISIMRKVVHEDRSGANSDENHVVHATCAAMIWHLNLGEEALKLSDVNRTDKLTPSKKLVDLWRYAQRMRLFLGEGDLQNAKEQASSLARLPSGDNEETNEVLENEENANRLYPGAASDVRANVFRNAINRGRYLMDFNSGNTEDLPIKFTPNSSTGSGKSKKAHKQPSLEEQILSYIQSGPSPEAMRSFIRAREKASKFRSEGYVAAASLLTEVRKTEDKTRILMGVLDVMHRPLSVHFYSDLLGASSKHLQEVQDSYQKLANIIIEECTKWMSACGSTRKISMYSEAKQESVVRALLCGLSVVVQDFSPRDGRNIESSGLIALLSNGACSPNNTIRALCQKWAELIFHRCCIAASPLNVNNNANNDANGDLLMLGLLEIFRSKIFLAAEKNIPSMALDGDKIQSKLVEITSGSIDTNVGATSDVQWLLDQQVLCDPTEPGFVCSHREAVPVNHSMGVWVWRPTGIRDGSILSKAGVITSVERVKPWTSLILKMVNGYPVITVADGKSVDGFTLKGKTALTPDGWSHIAYSINTQTKLMKVYVNGVLDATNELPLMLWCPRVHTQHSVQTIETPHNYRDNMNEYWHIKVEGAFKYMITCDPKSSTEQGCDYLRFYEGTTRTKVIGKDKYTGRMFPGVDSCPPLEIHASEFDAFFYSDSSGTDWGFKAEVTAFYNIEGQGGRESHENISVHPFVIGQTPAYASGERAATCAVANVSIYRQILGEEQLSKLPFYSPSPVSQQQDKLSNHSHRVIFSKDNTCVSCATSSQSPRNAFAFLDSNCTIFSITIDDISNCEGFSCGIVLKTSIAMKEKDDVILFGLNAVSYGIYYDGQNFDIRNSTGKKHYTTPRKVTNGDCITVIIDPCKSVIELRVKGPNLESAKKFGLATGAADPDHYLVGVSLGAGQKVSLYEDKDVSIGKSTNKGNEESKKLSFDKSKDHGCKLLPLPKEYYQNAYCDVCRSEDIGDQNFEKDNDDYYKGCYYCEPCDWVICYACSTKEENSKASTHSPFVLEVGAKVRIRQISVEEAKSLQTSHGGWVSRMEEFLGKIGVIQSKSAENKWAVRFEGGTSYTWNGLLLESPTQVAYPAGLTPPSVTMTDDGRFAIGCHLTVVPTYASYSDASGGPLKPGDIGELVVDDRGAKPYKVESLTGDGVGRTWWYEANALELYRPPAVSADNKNTETIKGGFFVKQFDIGLCVMSRPKNISTFGSCDVSETIGIIGAICRIAQQSVKKGVSRVERILAKDMLDPLLRIAFCANSIKIRLASSKAVSLLLPHSPPDIGKSIIQKMGVVDCASFVDFAMHRIGAHMNPFCINEIETSTKVSTSGLLTSQPPLAFTEALQLLHILQSLLHECEQDGEWDKEITQLVQDTLEGAKEFIDKGFGPFLSQGGNNKNLCNLIGFLSLCKGQNDLLTGLSPGSCVLLQQHENGVSERHIVLSHANQGCFGEYYDTAPDNHARLDNGLVLVRAHKSSIRLDNRNIFQLPKLVTRCMSVLPEKFFGVLLSIIDMNSSMENNSSNTVQDFFIPFMKALAVDVISYFVYNYDQGNIDPSDNLDRMFRKVCDHWKPLAISIAKSNLTLGSPMNTSPPEDIDAKTMSLLQVILDRRVAESMNVSTKSSVLDGVGDSVSHLKSLMTMWRNLPQPYVNDQKVETTTDMIQFSGDENEVPASLLKIFKASTGGNDCSKPFDRSDAEGQNSQHAADPKAKQKTKSIRLPRCKAGHYMPRVTGMPKEYSNADLVTCDMCDAEDIQSDTKHKFYHCPQCNYDLCYFCGNSLCGDIISGNFKTVPMMIRSEVMGSMIQGLEANVINRMYTLLAGIFTAWPSNMSLLENGATHNTADTFAHIELLLKLGGFHDVDTAVGITSSRLIEAFEKSTKYEGKTDSCSLPSTCAALLTFCKFYFERAYQFRKGKLSTPEASIDLFVASSSGNMSSGALEKLDISIGSVSSANRSATNMLTESTSNYWNSSGSIPHWFEVNLPDGCTVSEVILLTNDYESYSPQTINVIIDGCTVRSGIELRAVEEWVTIASDDDLKLAGCKQGRVLRIEITKNHQGGCDCKVASIKVLGSPYTVVNAKSDNETSDEDVNKKVLEKQVALIHSKYGITVNTDDLSEVADIYDRHISTPEEKVELKLDFDKLEVLKQMIDSQEKRDIINENNRPSLVIACKLLDMITNVNGGSILFQHQDGSVLIDGLSHVLSLLQYAPPKMIRYIISLHTKIFNLAKTQLPQMLPSSLSALKVCAANLVKLAKMITFQLSKNLSTNLSSAEMYHDILQGVVLCVNNLSVSLVENNTKKDDQKKGDEDQSEVSLMIESVHPFTDTSEEFYKVTLANDNSNKCFISFDADTNIDPTHDMVRIFRDSTKTAFWGKQVYTHTTTGLPGRGGLPPLCIPSNTFYVQFINSGVLGEKQRLHLIPSLAEPSQSSEPPRPPPASVTIRNGDEVELAPGYESIGNAAEGPLRPGDFGVVIDSEGIFAVEAITGENQGMLWGYERAAIQPREILPPTPGLVDTPAIEGTVHVYKLIDASFQLNIRPTVDLSGTVCGKFTNEDKIQVIVEEEALFVDPKPRGSSKRLCQDRRLRLADGRGYVTHSTYKDNGDVDVYLMRCDLEGNTIETEEIFVPEAPQLRVTRRYFVSAKQEDEAIQASSIQVYSTEALDSLAEKTLPLKSMVTVIEPSEVSYVEGTPVMLNDNSGYIRRSDYLWEEVDLVDSIYKVKDEFQMRVREGIDISSDVKYTLSAGSTFEACQTVVNEEGITRTRLSDCSGWTSFMGGGEVYLDLLSAPSYPIDSCGHPMQFMLWAKGGHDGKYKTGWNCDKCKRKSSKMSSSDAAWCAGRYCCVKCTSDICIDCFLLNRAGVPISLGTGSGKSNYYCGRNLGEQAIPGSDGRCGINSGPQCEDCKGLTKSSPPPRVTEQYKRRNGFIMRVSNKPSKTIKPGDFEPRIIESTHPYPDSASEYKTIEIPGASGYNITFSPESRTEHSYDFIRFYKDDRHNEYWGESKYSGGQGGSSRNFPGVDGHPPLIIPASKFVFHFQSDGSRNDWGYKITVTPHNEAIAMENSMHRIQTLVRLHKTLTTLSELDVQTRSTDEALILFMETEKKDKITNSDSLRSLDWATLCKDNNPNQLAAYPDLLAVASSDKACSSDDSKDLTLAETLKLQEKSLEEEQKRQVEELMEVFPQNKPSEIISVCEETSWDMERASALLLEGNGNRQESQGASVKSDIGTSTILSSRYELIKQLNFDFEATVDMINFAQSDKPYAISYLIGVCRKYLLYVTKQQLFNKAMDDTSGSGDAGEITVSRSKAMKFTARGECDSYGLWSMFGQTFRSLHSMSPSLFRQNKEQLWRCLFAGERGHDAGGLYRELWSIFSAEIMSNTLPLLLPCANSTALFGQNRETFILNPDSTSAEQIQMFEFLGKLMGMAVRCAHYLDIMISPMAWKMIVGEKVSLDDYVGVDASDHKSMKRLRSFKNEEEFMMSGYDDLTFTATSLGGRTIELRKFGRMQNVTWETLPSYCDELEAYRLQEMEVVATAIRRGLSTILPPLMINLIKWKDLETLVCGNPDLDVELLKSATEYSSYSGRDDVIRWFWEILTEFSQNDRKSYLRFTWGRNRLPLNRAGFKQRMKIAKMSCSGRSPDLFLPVSHTCFFSIDIPQYTNKETMKSKLLYAIHNCVAIDGDDTSTGMRAAALGIEDF